MYLPLFAGLTLSLSADASAPRTKTPRREKPAVRKTAVQKRVSARESWRQLGFLKSMEFLHHEGELLAELH